VQRLSAFRNISQLAALKAWSLESHVARCGVHSLDNMINTLEMKLNLLISYIILAFYKIKFIIILISGARDLIRGRRRRETKWWLRLGVMIGMFLVRKFMDSQSHCENLAILMKPKDMVSVENL
jgi:hypothetical protein